MKLSTIQSALIAYDEAKGFFGKAVSFIAGDTSFSIEKIRELCKTLPNQTDRDVNAAEMFTVLRAIHVHELIELSGRFKQWEKAENDLFNLLTIEIKKEITAEIKSVYTAVSHLEREHLLSPKNYLALMKHKDPVILSWAIWSLCSSGEVSEAMIDVVRCHPDPRNARSALRFLMSNNLHHITDNLRVIKEAEDPKLAATKIIAEMEKISQPTVQIQQNIAASENLSLSCRGSSNDIKLSQSGILSIFANPLRNVQDLDDGIAEQELKKNSRITLT